MARTNIVLDDRLIDQAMRLTGARTKREAVDTASRDLVRTRGAWRKLEALRGKYRWEGDLGALRRSRVSRIVEAEAGRRTIHDQRAGDDGQRRERGDAQQHR